MQTIKKIFSTLYNNRGLILIITTAIILLLFVNHCRSSQADKQLAKQNEAFYTEKIKETTLKNGQHEYEKAVLQTTVANLKKDTSTLAKAVVALQNEGKKPQMVVVTKLVYRDKEVVTDSIIHLSGQKYAVDFSYMSSDSVIKLTGKNEFYAYTSKNQDGSIILTIKPDSTYLDTINLNIGLTLGMAKDKDGIERAVAKPNSPKFNITKLDATDLEAYLANKTKLKRFGVGMYAGYGITIGTGVSTGFQIGFGIQRNIIRF